MEIQILMKGEGPLQPVTSHIKYALKSNFGALFFFAIDTDIFQCQTIQQICHCDRLKVQQNKDSMKQHSCKSVNNST